MACRRRASIIITDILFQVVDFRRKPCHCTVWGRDMFMCCFDAAGSFLVGMNGKLWRLRSSYKKPGYKRNWPWWSHYSVWVSNRPCMEFCWVPRYSSVYKWDDSCDLREYLGKCVLFEKRGRNVFMDMFAGYIEDQTHLLIRLQRWGRRMIRMRRGLALCMGMHARLGDKSLLGGLGSDIISLIVHGKTS